MLNRIIATLAGLVAALAEVMIIEGVSHMIYPPPEGIDISDPAEAAGFLAGVPVAAILLVLLAWVCGAFTGALIAGWLSKPRNPVAAIVVVTLVVAGMLANLVMIPHPLWFSISAVIAVPLAGWLGYKIVPPAKAEAA